MNTQSTHAACQAKPKTDPAWLVHAAGVSLLVAIAGVTYLTTFHPALEARSEELRLSGELTQAKGELASAEQTISNMDALMVRLERKLHDGIELHPASAANTTVAAINTLIEEHALRLTKLDPGEPQAGAQFDRVPIQLAGEGEYADVVRFLDAMNSSMRDVDVEAFTITGSPETDGAPVTFALALRWFTLPEKSKGTGDAGGAGRAASASRE